MPERVQVVGNWILIVDNVAPLKLVVADTSGRIAFRAVPAGDGPGEAKVIRNVGVFRDTIYAWSSGRQQLLLRPLTEDTVIPRRALTQAGEPRLACRTSTVRRSSSASWEIICTPGASGIRLIPWDPHRS